MGELYHNGLSQDMILVLNTAEIAIYPLSLDTIFLLRSGAQHEIRWTDWSPAVLSTIKQSQADAKAAFQSFPFPFPMQPSVTLS